MQGRNLSALRVSSIRRTDAARVGANNQFILTPAALEGFPVIYYGAIRALPNAVANLQRAVFGQFPTVTVVNAADILDIVQSVVDRISLTVRFLSAFAIVGGVIILASAVAGTRYRRMREVAILKTIGATRWKIVRIFSLEFLVIGLTAGRHGRRTRSGVQRDYCRSTFSHHLSGRPGFPVSFALLTGGIAVAAMAGQRVSVSLVKNLSKFCVRPKTAQASTPGL